MVENGERVSGVCVHKAVKEKAKNLILFLIFSRKQGDASNNITNYHNHFSSNNDTFQGKTPGLVRNYGQLKAKEKMDFMKTTEHLSHGEKSDLFVKENSLALGAAISGQTVFDQPPDLA